MEDYKCKGARDLLPDDMIRFRYIEDVFRNSCLGWGYQEVRTPTLEYLHLFTATGTLTPSMLNRVYSFLDWDGWSGERVVLRPDGTIPIARLFTEFATEQKVARFFYVTNVFAFEETGKVNRERWQCGVELLDSSELTGDIEIILLASEILRNLGITNASLHLSHAGMIKALLREAKLSPEREAKLLDEILDGNWQVLGEIGAENRSLEGLLSMLAGMKGRASGFLENLKVMAAQISPALVAEFDNFTRVTSLLDALGQSYQIDVTSTRGFEYYTGVSFQFLVEGDRVGGGGRYDDLIPLVGGGDTSACGFAFYMDSLMDMVRLGNEPGAKRGVLIRAEAMSPGVIESCFRLAQLLRGAGHEVELAFAGRETGRRWLVTVGERAVSPFGVTDRDQNRKREVASVSEVIDVIEGS